MYILLSTLSLNHPSGPIRGHLASLTPSHALYITPVTTQWETKYHPIIGMSFIEITSYYTALLFLHKYIRALLICVVILILSLSDARWSQCLFARTPPVCSLTSPLHLLHYHPLGLKCMPTELAPELIFFMLLFNKTVFLAMRLRTPSTA